MCSVRHTLCVGNAWATLHSSSVYVGRMVGVSVGVAVLSLHGVGAMVGSSVGVLVGTAVGGSVGELATVGGSVGAGQSHDGQSSFFRHSANSPYRL